MRRGVCLGLGLLAPLLALAGPVAADPAPGPLLRLTHLFSGPGAAAPAAQPSAAPGPAATPASPRVPAAATLPAASSAPAASSLPTASSLPAASGAQTFAIGGSQAAALPIGVPPAVGDAVVAANRPTVVPLPRLRPLMPPGFAAANTTKPASAAGKIDPIVTAAIDPNPPAPVPSTGTAAAIPPAPSAAAASSPSPAVSPPATAAAAAAVAAAASRTTAAEPDGLLGDPTASFQQTPAQPDAPRPQSIALPRPTAATPAAVALPPAEGDEPYQRLRQLQLLQDRTAQGSVEALTAERALMTAMDQAFVAADPAVWREPENAVAAVAFVLSGGPPTILAKLATLDPKPAVDLRLVTGVLAYAQGRQNDAAAALTPIDAMTLPPTIAAEVAMAQSALVAKANPEQAMHLLSLARLMAPGTLVEEAAIRREIFVADQLRQDDTVESLARQYLDRFRHSVYAGNFRDRFAAALTHMDFVNDPAQFSQLDDMLASLEPDARVELYLTVALAGVVAGRVNEATLSASRALSLTVDGSIGVQRAHLYRAAAEAVSAKTFDAAGVDYAAIVRGSLSASDQVLYDAVGVAIAAVGAGTTVTVPPGPAAPPDPPSTLMARAQTTLSAVDALLAKSAL